MPVSGSNNAQRQKKGGRTLPIRWSALKVSEAMDMVDGYVIQATEPLEQARLMLHEARRIPNLPQYVMQHISATESEIERAIGGSYLDPIGRIRSSVELVRKSLPIGAVDDQRKQAEYGITPSLIRE
jgi:hypothetical protein